MDTRIVDCDQHVIEPPDLWEKYLPAKYQDHAPKLGIAVPDKVVVA